MFFALAPAGIYEMGGADYTRTIRLVLPAADVRYVREKLLPDHGRANSCWWLSRGKARHLFKACTILRDLPTDTSASQVARIIREQLDHIGQHPTEVPAAVTDGLAGGKVPFLLNLAPGPHRKARCYHLDACHLDEGLMADRLVEAFDLSMDVALVFAEYFRLTMLALSDSNYVAYIPDNELPDALCLALDHLLEYEYGNPQLVPHMSDVLSLYQRALRLGSVHSVIGWMWEAKQTTEVLPLALSEIKARLPFPIDEPTRAEP